MSPSFYTVSEVAGIFSVTPQAVRDWIRKGQLMAIQPSGENGVYRIPAPALDAMRRRRGELPRVRVRDGMPTPERARSRDIYVAKIKPALDRSRSTPEELLRRAEDGDPSTTPFVRDYAVYVGRLADELDSRRRRTPRRRVAVAQRER